MRYFVAHAITGLSVDDVHISDTRGNIYDGLTTDGSGKASAEDSTALALQTEQWWENSIRSSIEQMLYKVYQEDNVSVSVRCQVELG